MRLGIVLRFVDVGVDALAEAREEIDALNVFPVPDGDTGTNMFLTFAAARDALAESAQATDRIGLASALQEFARGALYGARGNSGVILSQMIGAVAERMARARPDERRAAVLAETIRAATEASYRAVGDPVEGTMLTVVRAAAEATDRFRTEPHGRVREVFRVAAEAARAALARTPEQLPVLARAGVVDAGGRGLCVLLDAAEAAFIGRPPRRDPVPVRPPMVLPEMPVGDGPAYEVMYLLDANESAVAGLRTRLSALGDSLAVVGGAGVWNVHVHVDDVGAAIEAGIEAGRPHQIRVTHFGDQLAAQQRDCRSVLAVVAGPGLAALYQEAGAQVIPGGPGQRPSTGELLAALTGAGAHEVVVLPNDSDTIMTAQIAARAAEQEHGLRVAVIPTRAQVQGLAALAVHEAGRPVDQDVVEMTAAAEQTRHGAVTVAVRSALTTGGPCREGDALGVVDGDFVVVGDDLAQVGRDVVSRLLAEGGELVTLVTGKDEGAALAEALVEFVHTEHPQVEVVVYDGGQERYPLLIGVE